jgi:hypothetical protein
VYPVLRLHDLARERQRDMLQLAVHVAPRGVGERRGGFARLMTLFGRRLKARKSLAAVWSEGSGKLGA